MRDTLLPGLALPAVALAALVLAACDSPAETPNSGGPTISEAPSVVDRILVCESDEDSARAAVNRCVTSDVDQDELVGTLLRWGQAQAHFSDLLFDTESFKERYTLRDGERECLRRAFCKPMPIEN